MATMTVAAAAATKRQSNLGHRMRVTSASALAASLIVYLAMHGYSYYRLSIEERPFSPLHAELRSGGTTGIRLGILGVGIFGFLFLYPLRKRWKWLAQFGTTRRWLDFHVIAGITAPLVITFHSSFKVQGLAGVAYWIMIAVALSGFVGRYVYAQIPRSFNHAKLTMEELQGQAADLTRRLEEQRVFRPQDLAPLLRIPLIGQVSSMNLLALLWTMLLVDLTRPFHVSALRRKAASGWQLVTTFGGLLPTSNRDLEAIVGTARRQSQLMTRMAFLDRSERIFHLWHVVHRPFSLSFVVLIVVHIALALLLGYF